MCGVGGTVAYLQDADSDVNVMTLGNVKIEQHEYERAVGADGKFETITIESGTGYKLKPFTQGKPLYPTTNDDETPAESEDDDEVELDDDDYIGMFLG